MSYGTAGRYREVEVLSCSPERRVVLLFQHLVSNLRQALHFEQQKRRGEAIAKIGKAHAIVEELLYVLDHDKGGDIARNLAALYEHFAEQLLKAQKSAMPTALEGVLRCCVELHEAFSAAADQLEHLALPQAASA
jgi:flagellar protein FliS